MHDTNINQKITAVVRRRIKAGSEALFEVLMQEFMAFALKQPGHLSINVIRPSQGSHD
jgi:antibiotic biosynthesis monooxygenase (ABM) superfamily enzyme